MRETLPHQDYPTFLKTQAPLKLLQRCFNGFFQSPKR